MAKLEPIEEDGQIKAYQFDCPGCGLTHEVYVNPHRSENGSSWGFDGNFDYPTFTPSISARVQAPHKTMVCHFFVRQGMLQFLSDCTHELAGKTVPMLECYE